MKFIKAVLVVVLLSVATLLMIGVFVPEIDGEIETEVNAPIISVYASMLNTQLLPEWVVGLEKVERTSGILAMPGSTFKLYYKSKETAVVYDVEILEMIPLQSFKFRLYNEMMDVEVNVKFKSNGLKTDIDTYLQIKGNGLIVRSVLPLTKSVIMDEAEQCFENFKNLQER